MFAGTWKRRALAAEAELAALKPALEIAAEHLEGIEHRFANRAALVNLTRDGRTNRFTFLRNGQIFRIECMGTWDDDIDQWRRDLFE